MEDVHVLGLPGGDPEEAEAGAADDHGVEPLSPPGQELVERGHGFRGLHGYQFN